MAAGPAGSSRAAGARDGRRAGGRRALRLGGTVCAVAVTAALGCAVAPGLVARAGAEAPLDDAVTSAPFLAWAVSSVRADSGATGFVSASIARAELELTVRAPDGQDQLWSVRPQSLPRLVSGSPPRTGETAGEFFQADAEQLSRAWTRYAGSMTACGEEFTRVEAAAGAGGAARITAHCTRGDWTGTPTVGIVQDWIGTRVVQVHSDLGTAAALGSVLGDLDRLAPAGGAAVVRLANRQDCAAEALWPAEDAGGAPGGGRPWMDQTRLCSGGGPSEGKLPLTVVDEPSAPDGVGDAGAGDAAHRVDPGGLDAGLLARLLAVPELPTASPTAEALSIGWSDAHGQVVIVADSRIGQDAGARRLTITYALDGAELARG